MGGGRGTVCLKYLKRGETEKRGEDTKILKRGRGPSWVKGWVCQHPSHPIFYGRYMCCLNNINQLLHMINTIAGMQQISNEMERKELGTSL